MGADVQGSLGVVGNPGTTPTNAFAPVQVHLDQSEPGVILPFAKDSRIPGEDRGTAGETAKDFLHVGGCSTHPHTGQP